MGLKAFARYFSKDESYLDVNETRLHLKNCTPNLTLKTRIKVNRKYTIINIYGNFLRSNKNRPFEMLLSIYFKK